MIRLGGDLFYKHTDPEAWVRKVQQEGFRAARCPVGAEADESVIRAYRQAAEQHDIMIAEVGAWSNPISSDETERRQAIAYCKQQLYLADRIGALACVNIAGSRGEQWDGPHPDNFNDDTFALIVDTVREIVDDVQPSTARYALETMPWVFPDSADTYLDLLRAIDREAFAVHYDPVNMISSPRLYYRNAEMIRDFVSKLGSHIVTCHAKDIRLGGKLTVRLDEVRPGLGALDYNVLLRELHSLGRDIPVIIEHLPSAEESQAAAQYIREVAKQEQIQL